MSSMHMEIVRNYNGTPIGYIQTDFSGNKVIFDKDTRIIGYYDAVNDVTKDKDNHIRFRGDFSLALVTEQS